MTYELAKELKDAGFRLDYSDQEWHTYRPTFPTLSELIEACGDRFGAMDVIRFAGQPTIYVAGEYITRDGDIDSPRGEGQTPSEAVARLWLAIHKPVVK